VCVRVCLCVCVCERTHRSPLLWTAHHAAAAELEQALHVRQQPSRASIIALLQQSPQQLPQDQVPAVIALLEKYPTPQPVEVYNAALGALCEHAQALSEDVLALFGKMVAQGKLSSASFVTICRCLSSLEQIEALVAEAHTRKLLNLPLAKEAMQRYFDVAASLPYTARRARAWPLHRIFASFAEAKVHLPANMFLQCLEYLSACGMLRVAAQVYGLMCKEVPPSHDDAANLERLIKTFAQRARPRSASPVRCTVTVNFLRGLWDSLEDTLEKRGQAPPHASAEMHCSMARLLALYGDADAMRVLHSLAAERFPHLLSDSAFVGPALLASARTSDPALALSVATHVSERGFSPALASLVFSSITMLRDFHHIDAIARLVSSRLFPTLGPTNTEALIAEEYRLLSLRIAHHELTELRRSPVLLPVLRGDSKRASVPPQFVLGLRDAQTGHLHLLQLTSSGEGVVTSTGVHFSTLDDLPPALGNAFSCSGLGCLFHPREPPIPRIRPSPAAAIETETSSEQAQAKPEATPVEQNPPSASANAPGEREARPKQDSKRERKERKQARRNKGKGADRDSFSHMNDKAEDDDDDDDDDGVWGRR
jgi:hypothetical protein